MMKFNIIQTIHNLEVVQKELPKFFEDNTDTCFDMNHFNVIIEDSRYPMDYDPVRCTEALAGECGTNLCVVGTLPFILNKLEFDKDKDISSYEILSYSIFPCIKDENPYYEYAGSSSHLLTLWDYIFGTQNPNSICEFSGRCQNLIEYFKSLLDNNNYLNEDTYDYWEEGFSNDEEEDPYFEEE